MLNVRHWVRGRERRARDERATSLDDAIVQIVCREASIDVWTDYRRWVLPRVVENVTGPKLAQGLLRRK